VAFGNDSNTNQLVFAFIILSSFFNEKSLISSSPDIRGVGSNGKSQPNLKAASTKIKKEFLKLQSHFARSERSTEHQLSPKTHRVLASTLNVPRFQFRPCHQVQWDYHENRESESVSFSDTENIKPLDRRFVSMKTVTLCSDCELGCL
jgi:hypothetical protein